MVAEDRRSSPNFSFSHLVKQPKFPFEGPFLDASYYRAQWPAELSNFTFGCPWTVFSLLASLTHRPEETLCTALLFLHRFTRWNDSNASEAVELDAHVYPIAKQTEVACLPCLDIPRFKSDRTSSSNARNSRPRISVSQLNMLIPEF
jgi:hypothetical protein